MVEDVINEPRTSDSRECPVCQAPLHHGTTRCWLCGAIEAHRAAPRVDERQTAFRPTSSQAQPAAGKAELRAAGGEDIEEPAPPRPQHHVEIDRTGSFSLASLMMFMTLASVALGTITIAPGLGVPLAFVAFFTWLRTVGVVQKRATKGSAVTAGEKFLLFVRSFLSTIALLTLLGVVAAAALSAAVYTSCAIDDPHSNDSYVALAVVAAIITAVAIYATIKWIQYRRRRWRRDIGESE